jgi:hypothetical protein
VALLDGETKWKFILLLLFATAYLVKTSLRKLTTDKRAKTDNVMENGIEKISLKCL